AEADPEVDAALRTRSARVAVGVGVGLALGLLNQTNAHITALHALSTTALTLPPGDRPASPVLLDVAARLDGFGVLVALLLGLVCCPALASPPRRAAPAAPAPA